MRPEALRPQTARKAPAATPKLKTRLSKGEKRNRKRLAEVGAVYDLTPVPRHPTDVMGGEKTARRPAGPASHPLRSRCPSPRTSGSPRAWSTTPPRCCGTSSTKPNAATPPTPAPGWRWSTGTTTRSTASRPRPPIAASRSPSWSTSSTSSSTSGARHGASSTRPTPPPRPGYAIAPSPSWTETRDSRRRHPTPGQQQGTATQQTDEGRRLRQIPHQQGQLPRLPHRARLRLADRDRRDRRSLPPPRQGPHGHHRCTLERRGSRGSTPTTGRPNQRRLRRLLALPPRTRTRNASTPPATSMASSRPPHSPSKGAAPY